MLATDPNQLFVRPLVAAVASSFRSRLATDSTSDFRFRAGNSVEVPAADRGPRELPVLPRCRVRHRTDDERAGS